MSSVAEGALQMEITEWVRPPPSWSCETCNQRIYAEESRIVRKYCSNACRQKAYRERHQRR